MKLEKGEKSPKSVQVRTGGAGKRGKESEAGPSSDRTSKKKRKRVQSKCKFGLKKMEKEKMSPKLPQVQAEDMMQEKEPPSIQT